MGELYDATILAIELKKQGVSKDGRAWNLWRYQIQHGSFAETGKRWLSTFNDFDVKAGDLVDIEYVEKPNPLNPKWPYLNIRKMKLSDNSTIEEHIVDEATGTDYGTITESGNGVTNVEPFGGMAPPDDQEPSTETPLDAREGTKQAVSPKKSTNTKGGLMTGSEPGDLYDFD